MTIIAVAGRSMAADTFTTNGFCRDVIPPGTSKIVKCPDGSLFGACGAADNTYALKQWALAGMNFAKPPALRREPGDDEGNYWIWLRPDGDVFYGGLGLSIYPAPLPAAIGEPNAQLIVKTALRLGKGLKQALFIAFEDNIWIGGDVHLLTLDTPAVTAQMPLVQPRRLEVVKNIPVELPPAAVPRIPERY